MEQRIGDVPAVRNIGALSLETQPLKAALRAEAASWKAQFARNLHKQSAEDLRVRGAQSVLLHAAECAIARGMLPMCIIPLQHTA